MIPIKLKRFISHNLMNGIKSYLISYKIVKFDSENDSLVGVFSHARYQSGSKQKKFYNYIYFTNETGGVWTLQSIDSIGKIKEIRDISDQYALEAFNKLIEDKDSSTLWQVSSMELSKELIELLIDYKVELVEQIEKVLIPSTKKDKNESKTEVNSEVVPTESQSELSEIQPKSKESEVINDEKSEVTDSPSE